MTPVAMMLVGMMLVGMTPAGTTLAATMPGEKSIAIPHWILCRVASITPPATLGSSL
jgi:hypothetical protein